MFFSITGRLLPGADDVELLDVLVPEHGGGQLGLKLGVVLGSSDEEVLCPHSHNRGYKIKTISHSNLSWRYSPWPCYWSPSPESSPAPRHQSWRYRWDEMWCDLMWCNVMWDTINRYWPGVIFQSQLGRLGQMDSLGGLLEIDSLPLLSINILQHRLNRF